MDFIKKIAIVGIALAHAFVHSIQVVRPIALRAKGSCEGVFFKPAAEEQKSNLIDLQQQYAELMSLGEKYFSGTGVQKDYLKAQSYFHKALEAGETVSEREYAHLYLGFIFYYGGYGVEKNWENGVDHFTPVVHSVNIDATAQQLGRLFLADIFYTGGHGAARNWDGAKDQYQLLREANVPVEMQSLANYRLGRIYYIGSGFIEKNLLYAQKFFEESKHVCAYRWLGELFSEGADGVEKNWLKARVYYQRALAYDSSITAAMRAEAYLCIAHSYRFSQYGVEKIERSRARDFYEKIIEEDSGATQFQLGQAHLYLGEIYYRGCKKIPQNFKRAAGHLIVAARNPTITELELFFVKFLLGDMHARHGIIRSAQAYKIAETYFLPVSVQCIDYGLRAQAELSLGLLYLMGGYSLQKDVERAESYIKLAAQQTAHAKVKEQAEKILERLEREKKKAAAKQ